MIGTDSHDIICIFGMLRMGGDGCLFLEDLETSIKLNISLAVYSFLNKECFWWLFYRMLLRYCGRNTRKNWELICSQSNISSSSRTKEIFLVKKHLNLRSYCDYFSDSNTSLPLDQLLEVEKDLSSSMFVIASGLSLDNPLVCIFLP